MTKKKSILVDAHVFDHEHQGSRTYIREIYKILIRNTDISFYFAAHNIENLKKVFGNGKNVFYLPIKTQSSIKRLLFEWPAIIRKIKPDYAHFQYIVPPLKLCKYIVTTHDVLFTDFPEDFPKSHQVFKKILYSFGVKTADHITTVSEYSKGAINRHFGIPLGKIHVTPNGISDVFFEKFDNNEAKKRIKNQFGIENYLLCVSRIEPRKQQGELLKIFLENELYLKGYHFVLIGHQSLPDSLLDNLIEQMEGNAKAYVHILNNISDDDLVCFYRAARLFIYPSKSEGFGIPPLEAAAVGIPVICSNTTAMEDFSFFGDNHVDPNNSLTLETSILRNLNQPVPKQDLEKISQIVKEKYTWQKSADKLQSLITT